MWMVFWYIFYLHHIVVTADENQNDENIFEFEHKLFNLGTVFRM